VLTAYHFMAVAGICQPIYCLHSYADMPVQIGGSSSLGCPIARMKQNCCHSN